MNGVLGYITAFAVGGAFCVIAQVLIDKTKLTPARILVSYVVAGVVLTGLGLYELMSSTGHKKVDTLKFYIDRFGKSRREKFEKVNNILNTPITNESN